MAGTYEARFSRLGRRLVEGVDRKIVVGATAALNKLIDTTPADTGRAISNWRLGVGAAARMGDAIPAYVPGRGGSTRAINANLAYHAAMQVLATRRQQQSILIYNAVPYIGGLNAGRSAQAPAGFIEMALQASLVGMEGVKIF